MQIRLPTAFKNYLIARAMRTPYFHLESYMERYWLVPYATDKNISSLTKEGTGCYNVCIFKRPIAWLFQKLGIAIRVHKILRSDSGRDFHNHPWNFITVLLKGSYFEITPKFGSSDFYEGAIKTFYGKNTVLFRKHKHFHRLELLIGKFFNKQGNIEIQYLPVWTLFIIFRKKRTWGFLEKPYGVTPHFLYKDKV